MPLSPVIEWENPTYRQITASIRNQEVALVTYQRLVQDEEARLQLRNEWRDLFRSILGDLPQRVTDELASLEDIPSLYGPFGRSEGHQEAARLEEALGRFTESISNSPQLIDYRRQLNQIEAELATLHERLSRFGPDSQYNRLDRKDLLAAIRKLDNVDPGRVYLGKDRSDRPYFVLRFTDIQLKPDRPFHFNSRFVSPHDNRPTFPLQNVNCRFYLDTGEIQVAALRGESNLNPFEFSGWQPHPHVLGVGSPCLGDFAGPIREAVEDQDWQTLIALTRQFLSRAVLGDTAGRNFIPAFIRHIVGLRRSHSVSTTPDDTPYVAGYGRVYIREREVPGTFVTYIETANAQWETILYPEKTSATSADKPQEVINWSCCFLGGEHNPLLTDEELVASVTESSSPHLEAA